MQENQSLDNRGKAPAGKATVGRHRAPSKPRNAHPYLASLAIAVVGFGLAGVSAQAGSDEPEQPSVVSVGALDERADAADRGDRSSREEIASASPSASSPSAATPSASTAAPSPSQETEEPVEPEKTPDWVHPMPGATVTSCYGPRWGTLHAGIDLAKPANTPVRAAGAGTVVTAGWAYSGYGISVVIDHGNGYLTHYAHLNRTDVQVGDKVAPGDVIGREGSTGDSTGPHLHFEVHNGMWNQVNPSPWMRNRGVELGC